MKVYVILQEYPYEGNSTPLIATIFKKQAMKLFKALVDEGKADKESYTSYELLEYDEQESERLAYFDFQDWSNKQAIKEWKKKNPGKKLPVHRSGIICTTTPMTYDGDGCVSVEFDPIDYQAIEKDLQDD